MNTERILSAGMAVVLIAAVGLSASTLAASMSTDPSDAVDIQWDALPLGEDSQGEIEAAAERVDETYQQSGDSDEQREVQASGGSQDPQGGDEAGDQEAQSGSAGNGGARAESDGQGGPEQVGQSDRSGLGGLAPVGPPWTRLLWLALLLGLLGLAYRYRDRLRRVLGSDSDGPAAEPLAPAPENEIERAWVELVERAGIDRPRTRTPRDCARRAVEAGFDPGHVDRLRRTFEDVRYGTTPPTDEQARLARETLARFDGERA